MALKVWVINMVLTVVVLFIVLQAADIWTRKEQVFPQTTVSGGEETNPVLRRVASRKSEPVTAYDLIAEKTLFSEDRAVFIPETTETETAPGTPQTQASRQPVFLYGVVMVGDYRKALVKDTATRSGEDRWVYVGDRIGGMTVKAIENDKLLLASASETIEVLLYDRTKPRSSLQVARADTPTVVTLSSEKTAPPVQSSSSAQKSETQKPADQEKPVKKDSASISGTEDASDRNGKYQMTEPASETAGASPRQASPFPQLPNQDKSSMQEAEEEFGKLRIPFGEIGREIN